MRLAQERSSPKAETLEGRTSGLLFVFGPRPSILRRVINYSLATEGTQGFSKPMEEILTDRVKGVGLELLTESIASVPRNRTVTRMLQRRPGDGALHSPL